MGRSYHFDCSRCGYRVAVSGGPDTGVRFWVQTIGCRGCKALHDAVVRLKVVEEPSLSRWRNVWALVRQKASLSPRPPTRAPSFQEAIARLPVLNARSSRWIQFRAQCPVSASHQVEVWNEPGKCPKCGQFMERGALPFRLWD
jgi:hypothetical protein